MLVALTTDMSAYDTDHEEDKNDGWGLSLYNDNKGIKMTILFTPLPAPLAPGKKRHVNISNEKDYKQMVDKATSKSPFEVKLFIIENKTGNGEDDPEEDAEHEEAVGSRKM
ncbi:uncharacterized protein LACBIDRAFT_327887 [Laccaria bicolor S238N-H82]|uniref:Predicted protein n=1 Tax=Laccaria bicolor (strain S238N-H82 / ATCC MYA-4686) TaxID=486041 RepID=B0DD48_LACBS|nr:uncharacterized protein LACBIDRAFT_327887 [Laccaria bicolor S238N-H82]EDR07413.1 predicted protein [Laccaria bicolor S238N-H82]|eukprot:XP_001881805.1 predicted protein [Laccaria bicolor S238N-H82]